MVRLLTTAQRTAIDTIRTGVETALDKIDAVKLAALKADPQRLDWMRIAEDSGRNMTMILKHMDEAQKLDDQDQTP